ncbi:fasciclin domain-containing protein [Spirosoma lituiforme]
MNAAFLIRTRQIAMIALLFTVLSGCKKGDDTVATPQTITDRLIEDSQFSFLRAAMIYAEVGDVLKGGNLTLFAPNDAAFQASGFATPGAITAYSKEQMRAILLYHVLGGPVSAATIPSGQSPIATVGKSIAYLNSTSDGKIFVNNAQIIQADIAVANGYIHSIDRVLTPPSGNLLTTIQTNPNLTFLVAAIQRIGTSNPTLLTTLNSESTANAVTVFAPNDAAFKSAGYRDLAAINSANVQTLTNTLLYHVVSGALFANQLQSGSLNTFLNGNRLTVTATANQLTIKGNRNSTAATIKQGDQPTTNGIIHVIDQVLLP